MTTRSYAEICEILDDNGPDLLERIELSERFYQYLTSEKVVHDRTLIRDLKVVIQFYAFLKKISFRALPSLFNRGQTIVLNVKHCKYDLKDKFFLP